MLDAFLPDPASPSVAAVYLTVRNSGATAEDLVGVSSTEARTSMLMTEQADGSVGSMRMLKDVRVPAHGEVSLVPGHDHVMLEGPKVTLKIGQVVPLTLRFAGAGALTEDVKVGPLTEILDQGATAVTTPSPAGMSNMAGM